MELAFASKRLRTICESEAEAIKEFGPELSDILKHRLADMRAATSPNDLVAGNPRVKDNATPQYMTLELSADRCIHFCANHPSDPTGPREEQNWSKVTRVKIIGIKERDD